MYLGLPYINPQKGCYAIHFPVRPYRKDVAVLQFYPSNFVSMVTIFIISTTASEVKASIGTLVVDSLVVTSNNH